MFKNLFHSSSSAFGLEISNASVKVLELKKIRDKYKLSGRRRELVPNDFVLNNEIINEDGVASIIKKSLENSHPCKIKTKNVVISLPENKTFIKTFTLSRYNNKTEQDEKIAQEIEKYIPLSLSEVYFDWQIIKTMPQYLTVFTAAVPKKLVDSYQNTIIKSGLTPLVFDLEAAAEIRTLVPQKSNNKNEGTLIIDIGETKTILIVSENDNIPYTASLTNISGAIFTKTVAEKLNISETEAEKLKLKCHSLKVLEKERRVLEAMHSVLDLLSLEIEKVLNYYQNHFESHREIEEILLCGGGAGMTGIAKYLSLKLRKKVKLGNPWTNIPLISVPPMDINESLSFTKTIGLALRATEL